MKGYIAYPKFPKLYPGKVTVRLLVVELEAAEIVAGQEVAFGVGDTESEALQNALDSLYERVRLVTDVVKARRKELCQDPDCYDCNREG